MNENRRRALGGLSGLLVLGIGAEADGGAALRPAVNTVPEPQRISLAEDVYRALRTVIPNLPDPATAHVRGVQLTCVASEVPLLVLEQYVVLSPTSIAMETKRFKLVPLGVDELSPPVSKKT